MTFSSLPLVCNSLDLILNSPASILCFDSNSPVSINSWNTCKSSFSSIVSIVNVFIVVLPTRDVLDDVPH